MRRRLVIAGLLLLALAAAMAVCNAVVVRAGEGRLYTEVAATPRREVGLLLGTSDKRKNGASNPFFTHRIDAAAALYHAGKVSRLLVSGDNRRKDYDEPAMMKAALLQKGVPESAITVDCAGFRTLDSVVRARDVFCLTQCTVISQRFHDQRALLIARHEGIDAIGFCAADVGFGRGLKTQIRETFARVKAVLDLYVLRTQPKFRGPKIPLA